MSNIQITAVYEPSSEGGYIAYIEEIPGINTQGETLEEAKDNLADAVNLMFQERRSSLLTQRKGRVKNIITQTLTFTL